MSLLNTAPTPDRLSITKKTLDLPPVLTGNKSRIRFRKRFSSFALLAITLCASIAGVSAMSMKNDMASLAFEAQARVDDGIHSLLSEQYLHSMESFGETSRLISEMRALLHPFLLSTKFTQNSLKEADGILQIAAELSDAGSALTRLALPLKQIPELISASEGGEALSLLKQAEAEIFRIKSLTGDLKKRLDALDHGLLAVGLEDKINSIDAMLPAADEALASLASLTMATEILLGAEGLHTSLVLFQNSGEIRATGGFPGSLMLISSEQGEVTQKFQDIYYYAWQNSSQLPPPPGFERISDRMLLHDANYSFDFPTSAAEIRKTFELSTGPKAQTVVVITDRLLVEILKETGPIVIPETDAALSAENLRYLLPYLVEAKISGRHTPKEVINQLLPDLKKEVQALPSETLMRIAKRAIKEKWILAHSTDPRVEETIQRLNIDGQIKASPALDYLAVVSANVGGNKSDNFIHEELHVASVVTLDRRVTNTLTIERRHTWDDAAAAQFEALAQRFGSPFVPIPLLKDIIGAGENHSYTQVFVPEGSELLEVSGLPVEVVETFSIAGKTIFAFRFPKVTAGTSESVSLRYLLPDPVAEEGNLDLYFQSQPGRDGINVFREILPESGLKVDHEQASRLLYEDALFSAKITNENSWN